jgi:hypothetical protein
VRYIYILGSVFYSSTVNFDNSFVVRDNECSALVCIMCNDIIPPKCESLYLLQAVEGLPSDRNRLTLSLYMGVWFCLPRVWVSVLVGYMVILIVLMVAVMMQCVGELAA